MPEQDKNVLYNTIGTAYNTTRRADHFISDKLFELLSPKDNGRYIDIGCGTGSYTILLAEKGINFYGLDPSEKMLDIARSVNDKIKWVSAKAENIPVDNGSFDGAIATLTIHHWADIKKAFREVHRVLNDDGIFIIFTAEPQQMSGYWLNHYFPEMMKAAIKQMPAFETIKAAAGESGFTVTQTEKYFIQPDLQDHFLYSGKYDPQLYLDENVRNGISSFVSLANLHEVEKGLTELSRDITNGKFTAIKQQYDNDAGDYLFIKLKKR